jgi:hypothetical protein
MDWGCGSSRRVPALPERSPEFKLQSHTQKNSLKVLTQSCNTSSKTFYTATKEKEERKKVVLLLHHQLLFKALLSKITNTLFFSSLLK